MTNHNTFIGFISYNNTLIYPSIQHNTIISNHNKRWFDKDNKLFFKMIKQNKSYKEIAIKLKENNQAQ